MIIINKPLHYSRNFYTKLVVIYTQEDTSRNMITGKITGICIKLILTQVNNK